MEMPDATIPKVGCRESSAKFVGHAPYSRFVFAAAISSHLHVQTQEFIRLLRAFVDSRVYLCGGGLRKGGQSVSLLRGT
jgi:hypothetical protein